MKMIHRIAVVFSTLALTAAGGALADPTSPPVGTLMIPAPFGSSPVVEWAWGASNSGASAGGAGKATVQDLSITRLADGPSPLFFKIGATGEHMPTVTLVDGATTITLTDVLITGYSTGDSPPGNNATRTESVTFNFAKVVYTVNGVTTCVRAGMSC